MTIRAIQSSSALSVDVAKSSQACESFFVSASDGNVRVLHRQPDVEAINSGPCVVYSVTPVAAESKRASFADFDSLAAEVAAEAAVGGQGSALVAEGRRWVARSFYDGAPTLSSLRLAAGLSQRQLGEEVGLEQPHISRYESGRHEPGLSTAYLMAGALGVPLDLFAQAWKNSRGRIETESSE